MEKPILNIFYIFSESLLFNPFKKIINLLNPTNMNENINKSALFNGSCFALITTAFTFAIRAGILPQLGQEFRVFQLNN
jgi:hypothetical protein